MNQNNKFNSNVNNKFNSNVKSKFNSNISMLSQSINNCKDR